MEHFDEENSSAAALSEHRCMIKDSRSKMISLKSSS